MRKKTRKKIDAIERRLWQLECPHSQVYIGKLLRGGAWEGHWGKICCSCGKILEIYYTEKDMLSAQLKITNARIEDIKKDNDK